MRKRPANKKQNSQLSLPSGIFNAPVSGFSSDGRGILHHDGNTVFVEGALPDEDITFSYTAKQKGHIIGKLHSLNQPSTYRVEPKCAYYHECGGCVLQHLDFAEQVKLKQAQLSKQFVQLKPSVDIDIETLAAKPWGYRRRARVGVAFDKVSNSHVVGFRAKHSNQLVNIAHCEVLAPPLSVLLTPLQFLFDGLSQADTISHIDMMLADNGVFISLRQIKAFTDADNAKLIEFSQQHKVNFYLQSEKGGEIKAFAHQQTPFYQLEIAGQDLKLNFLPSHFIQVNAEINQQLVTQAIDWLELNNDDIVLDLFAGLGNFTLPMARYAKQVVGIEGSRALVEWANKNVTENQLDNAVFYQANLSEDTRMMKWRKTDYNKVLIDPPRDGAQGVVDMIAKQIKPEKLLYVSCHPATLTRDLAGFTKAGYRIAKASSLAMFPHTAHSESMVLLERKS